MTPDHLSFVESTIAAERAGDAAAALEFHIGIPMYARSAHRVLLTQLAGLSEEMTGWLWARWAALQCTRTDEMEFEAGIIQRAALDYVVRMFYADRLEEALREGVDWMRPVSLIVGESWLFHQLCTFEMGGLAAWVDTLAAGRLAEHSDLMRDWVGASMGGYRLERSGPEGLVVRDLRTDGCVQLLDLGAAVHARGGGWLLGRLVPSGATPALMFDSRPIPVDEQTAREAAAGPLPGSWVAAVRHAVTDGRIDKSVFESEDRELVTDVPSLSLLELGTSAAALPSALDQLARGRDEIGRAAYRILRRAGEGRFGPDEQAAYVAAAVLQPHGYAEAWRHQPPANASSHWARWAGLVPEPARSRLLLLASERSAA